ncbi:hypothetical protein TrCOL_g1722 [Triparma columacea]|uniref:PDZ domain-containing protein n=1 Tax=Triparma columacea TaxID=722753 RepID=A0A9W7G7J6_9STRA|nr:hypothetical protein TrCOL_g1722 [Triparma columacea]
MAGGLVYKIEADPEKKLGLEITGGVVTKVKSNSVCRGSVKEGDQLISVHPGGHIIRPTTALLAVIRKAGEKAEEDGVGGFIFLTFMKGGDKEIDSIEDGIDLDEIEVDVSVHNV